MARGLVAIAAVLAWWAGGPSAGEGGEVAVGLRPAFEGLFRPGCPVWLWVTVANDGEAFEGLLDVVVDGVAYRRPLRVGAGAKGFTDAVVVARSEAARGRVVLRSRDGRVAYEATTGLGLRRRAAEPPLVVAAGAGRWAGEWLFGACEAAVGAEELPTQAAGYAAADAVGVEGDGAALPEATRAALGNWVRGGAMLGFLLDAGSPVGSGSLLAELGGCAGRATAREWLAAVRARQGAAGDEGTAVWRLGLGTVAAATREGSAPGVFAGRLPAVGTGDRWADAGLYMAFEGARWTTGLRWRLVGGAAVLLAAGVLAARLGLRTRRRWAGTAATVGLAGLLTAVAWWVMLPSGRGWLETACVAERVAGRRGERWTEVVCLEALGRTRVRLDFGVAEAVVPFYYSADTAGSGDGAVVERDASGRWAVECGLTGRSRRSFGVVWPWRETAEPEGGVQQGDVLVRGPRFALAVEGGAVPAEGWRPLDELPLGGAADRALAAWLGRRAGAGALFRVRAEPLASSAAAGARILEQRGLAGQVWARVDD